MKTRRFVAALSLTVVLVLGSVPARADWQEPEPGPRAGDFRTGELLLQAASVGFVAATVAL
ncbi:MAG: hypothetical protein ACREOU_10765 [Candidatus Eiseniibacteriota bacterium]